MSERGKDHQEGKVLASSGYRTARIVRRGLTLVLVPVVWVLVLWALGSDPTVSRTAAGTIRIALSAFAVLSLLVALVTFISDIDSRLLVTSRSIIHRLGRPWTRVLEIPFSEVEQISLADGALRIKRRARESWINLGKDWKDFPALEKALRAKAAAKIR
ncbi:MAG: hypothetical protein ABSG98_05540 [Anaerolineales bacterium]|jgi:hypothetical protein